MAGGRKVVKFDLGDGAEVVFKKVKNADVETYVVAEKKNQLAICDYDNIDAYEYVLTVDNLEQVTIAKFSNCNSEEPPRLEKLVKIDYSAFLELLDALLNRDVGDLERKINYIRESLTEVGE